MINIGYRKVGITNTAKASHTAFFFGGGRGGDLMFVYYLIFVYCDLLGIFTIVARSAVPGSTVYNWGVFFS